MSGITEAEASRRWCPFAVEAGDGLCMGGACMAWRWSTTPPNRHGREFDPKVIAPKEWNVRPGMTIAEYKALGKGDRALNNVPANWGWLPVRLDDGGNIRGGVWSEPLASAFARYEEARRKCKGYCGIVGLGDAP